MNMAELLGKGAFVDPSLESRTVKWNNGTDDLEFAVEVKKEMSVADYEYIYVNRHGLGQPEEVGQSMLARRVHRMVRFGGEVMPLKDVLRLRISLLSTLADEISAVEKVLEPKN